MPSSTTGTDDGVVRVPKFDINDVGPHPGFIELSQKFVSERQIQAALQNVGLAVTKEELSRNQGVTMIDKMRTALGLYVLLFC